MKRRVAYWIGLAGILVGAFVGGAGCGPPANPRGLISVTGDGDIALYAVIVRDQQSHVVTRVSGWSSTSKMISKDALKIGLTLPHAGRWDIVILGAAGAPTIGDHVDWTVTGARQFFWANSVDFEGDMDLSAHLAEVKQADESDGDGFPNASTWPATSAAAGQVPMQLLDCNDMDMNINPFALEICGDGLDQDCDGKDAACVDSDGDGDPDSSDCKPNDPTIHHPTMKDPFPESPNCCGYSLGKQGADANKSFATDPICHANTCDDGIDQDCDGKDTPCQHDNDCDGYTAATMQPNGCSAPGNNPPGNDCDDCDPATNPAAAEVCDGKDNNCNGLVDETCVGCDLDGDGYERSGNGCPDNKDPHPGMVDCNDEDRGVFPGSTGTPTLVPAYGSQTCSGKEGGNPVCALRGACRNKNPDGSAQDADCMGGLVGCPPANCDADGDGFAANINGCTGPFDCNDNDPTIYPGAPSPCGETTPHDCNQIHTCGVDADKDGWDTNFDCNDNDPNVHPWAKEPCDGIDNDCDGLVDEGNPDGMGNPMVANGKVTACDDINKGDCAPTTGQCVCSSLPLAPNQKFDNSSTPARVACPGETDAVDNGSMPAPRCYFAKQPGIQTCDSSNPHDGDCDGRVDAPDGKNLAELGMPCWPGAKGQCAPGQGGTVVGCKMAGAPSNCYSAFGVNPWFMCQGGTCPTAEQCNGFDDDCNGALPANEADGDNDGYMACGPYSSCGVVTANNKKCGDCNDANPAIHPDAQDICNGVDDDCNSATADGAADCANPPTQACCGVSGCKNLTTDTFNCGMCGKQCALPHVQIDTCANQACGIQSCVAGYADCNTVASDGCEVTLATDPSHCGACANNCSTNNIASPTCSGGTCNGNCNPGFADCNNNKLTDGCEVNVQTDASHCGGCSNVCSSNNIASPTCGSGICNGACNSGFADCNNNKLTDGCEVNTQTDASHCGGCANVCSSNNMATVTCGSGMCNGTCNSGFADCNSNKLVDGCETNISSSATNCGGCGIGCSSNHMATVTCGSGMCNGSCAGGYADCNNNKQSDGCETNVSGDVNNCGGCGVVCDSTHSLGASCVGGVCMYTGCASGYADCSQTGNNANGCETFVGGTDVNNCGACQAQGGKCDTLHSTGATCASGVCMYTGCSAGYADCDKTGNDANGCESADSSSGCGLACTNCSVTQQPACVTSSNSCGCNTFTDCNSTTASGCSGGKCVCGGGLACNGTTTQCTDGTTTGCTVGTKCRKVAGQACTTADDCVSCNCKGNNTCA